MLRLVGSSPRHLARMIANLLEPHQLGQDQTAPLHPFHLLELVRQILDDLLIQGSLGLAQPAEGSRFDLVRQIGDNPLVGFQSPQDIGLDQANAGGRNGPDPWLQAASRTARSPSRRQATPDSKS